LIVKKQGLGKGLSALIPIEKKLELTGNKKPEVKPTGLANLPISSIKPNRFQPRSDFSEESLAELTASIAEKGIISPITVRKIDGGYELIAGERRYRAALKLNLTFVPAIIKQVTDEESLELALIENLQRDDLNPIEKAKGFQRLIDQFNLRQEDVAKRIGQDRSTVANILRLLQLPGSVQNHVSRGTLSMGHARALLSLTSSRAQEEAAILVIHQQLSVRQTEGYVKKLISTHPGYKSKPAPKPEVIALEDQLQRALGTKVRLQVHGKHGKIEIEFHSLDELDRLLDKFGVKIT
jgi:ParB family transcriptional regulator, chromosome partitioning protein